MNDNNKGTYWAGKGKFQAELNRLNKVADVHYVVNDNKILKPRSVNKHLEKLRVVQNVYYDYYNNGLCNRVRQARCLGLEVYSKGNGYYNLNDAALEKLTDQAVFNAYHEQQKLNWTIDAMNL